MLTGTIGLITPIAALQVKTTSSNPILLDTYNGGLGTGTLSLLGGANGASFKTNNNGSIVIAANGALSLDSTGATSGAVNLGTGSGNNTVTIGSNTGTQAITVGSGSSGLTLQAASGPVSIATQTSGLLSLASAGAVTIDAATTSIGLGSGAKSASTPIQIGYNNATSTQNITLSSGAQLLLDTTLTTVGNIKLQSANGGILSTVSGSGSNVISVTGTGQLQLNSSNGSGGIILTATGSPLTLDSSATVTGIAIGGTSLSSPAPVTLGYGNATSSQVVQINSGTSMTLQSWGASGTMLLDTTKGSGAMTFTSANGGINMTASGTGNAVFQVSGTGQLQLKSQASSQGILMSDAGASGITIQTTSSGNISLTASGSGSVNVVSAGAAKFDSTTSVSIGPSTTNITIGNASAIVNVPGSLSIKGNLTVAGTTTTVDTTTTNILNSAIFVNAVPLGTNDSGVFINRYPSDVVSNPPVSGNFYGSATILASATGTSAITSITVQPLTSAIASGATLLLTTYGNSQLITTSATASIGATTLSVTSFTPNTNYPAQLTAVYLQSTTIATSALNTSAAITTVTVAVVPASGWIAGQSLVLVSGFNSQIVTLTASATPGATNFALSLNSFTPNYAYPIGTTIAVYNLLPSTTLSVATGTSATTSLTVSALPSPGLPSGTVVQLAYGAVVQSITLSATAGSGATSLAVTSFTPVMAFPIGTKVLVGNGTSSNAVAPQTGLLTVAVPSGSSPAALSVQALSAAIPAGSNIQLTAGSSTNTFVTGPTANIGATSIPIASGTATANYPVGATVTVQTATLSVALTNGTPTSSIQMATFPTALTSGTQLLLTSGLNTQIITLAQSITAGTQSTAISVTSFTPNFSYPTTTWVSVLTNNTITLGSVLNIIGWILALEPGSANAESFQILSYTSGVATISGFWNNIHVPGASYTIYPGTYAGVFWKEGSNEFEIGTNAVGVNSLNGFNSSSPTFLYAGLHVGNLIAEGNITSKGNFTITGTTTYTGSVIISGSNTLTVGTGTTTLGGALIVNGSTTLNGSVTMPNNTAVVHAPESLSFSDKTTVAHIGTTTNLSWVAGVANPTGNISGTLNTLNATIPDGFQKKIFFTQWSSINGYVYSLYVNDHIVDANGNLSVQQDTSLSVATSTSATTSLTVNPVYAAIPSGTTIWIQNGSQMQSTTTNGVTNAGATTINVNSFTPSPAAFPIGSVVTVQIATFTSSSGSPITSLTVANLTMNLAVGTTILISSTTSPGMFQTATLTAAATSGASATLSISPITPVYSYAGGGSNTVISLLGSRRLVFSSAGQSIDLIWNQSKTAWYLLNAGIQFS